jgi:hypothetical protein
MNTQINQVILENITQNNEPPKQFTFDAVYPENSVTEAIYTDSVFPLVESVSVNIIEIMIEKKVSLSFRYSKVTMQPYLLMGKQGMNLCSPIMIII